MATHSLLLEMAIKGCKGAIKSSDPQDFKRMIATPNHKGNAIDLAQGNPQISKLLKPYQEQAYRLIWFPPRSDCCFLKEQ